MKNMVPPPSRIETMQKRRVGALACNLTRRTAPPSGLPPPAPAAATSGGAGAAAEPAAAAAPAPAAAASGGIGAAAARRFAEEGARLTLCDLDAEAGATLAARSATPAARHGFSPPTWATRGQ